MGKYVSFKNMDDQTKAEFAATEELLQTRCCDKFKEILDNYPEIQAKVKALKGSKNA